MRRDLRDISGGVKRRSIGPEARAGGPERPARPCGARTRLESDCRSPSSSAVGGRPGMTAARRYIAAAPREIKNLAIRPWPPSRGTRVAGLQIIFFARGRRGRPGGVSTGLGGAWVVPPGPGGGWGEKKSRISFRWSVLARNPSRLPLPLLLHHSHNAQSKKLRPGAWDSNSAAPCSSVDARG